MLLLTVYRAPLTTSSARIPEPCIGVDQGSLELSGWTGSGQAKGNFLKSYSWHRYFVIKIAML